MKHVVLLVSVLLCTGVTLITMIIIIKHHILKHNILELRTHALIPPSSPHPLLRKSPASGVVSWA